MSLPAGGAGDDLLVGHRLALCKAATFSTPSVICGSVIFKHAFDSIPRMGTFILHDGLTPEYLGLHTPL